MTASRQRIVKIYDDDSGDTVTLKDDDDGLDLIEILQEGARVVLREEQAHLLLQELRLMLGYQNPDEGVQK